MRTPPKKAHKKIIFFQFRATFGIIRASNSCKAAEKARLSPQINKNINKLKR